MDDQLNTRHKLNEADFFLCELERNYLNYPDFEYFLSAFISSARAVLWIMESEYNSIKAWRTW